MKPGDKILIEVQFMRSVAESADAFAGVFVCIPNAAGGSHYMTIPTKAVIGEAKTGDAKQRGPACAVPVPSGSGALTRLIAGPLPLQLCRLP